MLKMTLAELLLALQYSINKTDVIIRCVSSRIVHC